MYLQAEEEKNGPVKPLHRLACFLPAIVPNLERIAVFQSVTGEARATALSGSGLSRPTTILIDVNASRVI